MFIVGAGNSAGQAAIYLARSARSVTLLVRGDNLAKSMSDYLVKEIEHTPRVWVRLQTEVAAARGDRRLTELVLRDRATGREETVPAAALFVMIGATPHTGWLPGDVLRDQHGFILTGRDLPGQDQAEAGRAGAASAGNQPAGRVRGRRRARGLGQAGGLGRGRRIGRHPAGSPAPAAPGQPDSRLDGLADVVAAMADSTRGRHCSPGFVA